MKRQWTSEELVENFTLRAEERSLLGGGSPASQVGMAALIKFFEYEGRFPSKPSGGTARIRTKKYHILVEI